MPPFVEQAGEHEEAAVETPCASITKVAPLRPAAVKLKIPSTTNPRWLTEE
jgi:hypothetical protein